MHIHIYIHGYTHKCTYVYASRKAGITTAATLLAASGARFHPSTLGFERDIGSR